MALGSNREVDACLDLAVALGFLTTDALAKVYALSDQTQAMLFGFGFGFGFGCGARS